MPICKIILTVRIYITQTHTIIITIIYASATQSVVRVLVPVRKPWSAGIRRDPRKKNKP